MRVKLKIPKKSEACQLLGERLEDRSMPPDLWIRYFYAWERLATRKRKPGWAEDIVERVMRLEKDLLRRELLESDGAEHPSGR